MNKSVSAKNVGVPYLVGIAIGTLVWFSLAALWFVEGGEIWIGFLFLLPPTASTLWLINQIVGRSGRNQSR